jgi:threonine dehydratase
VDPIEWVDIAEIRAAAGRLQPQVMRSPLVPLSLPDRSAEIYLKLENLQPIGSFKLRGAGNAMAMADPAALANGVVTASAGNMAQGVAWNARRLGIPCHVVVPDHAPRTKIRAIERLGGKVVATSFERWWQALEERAYPGLDGHFIHPVSDPAVIAGNGTIGLEIVEDLPDVAAVVVPFGGGGLSCGIACAISATHPQVPVYAAEVETAAPLAASLTAGKPTRVPYAASFVDGIGSAQLLPEMWPLARAALAGSLVSTLSQIREAMRVLVARGRVVAEGAGAASVAAALSGGAGSGRIVCVVSGGNIDLDVLATILDEGAHGDAPSPSAR